DLDLAATGCAPGDETVRRRPAPRQEQIERIAGFDLEDEMPPRPQLDIAALAQPQAHPQARPAMLSRYEGERHGHLDVGLEAAHASERRSPIRFHRMMRQNPAPTASSASSVPSCRSSVSSPRNRLTKRSWG